MNASTRTPEGRSGHCPVCGARTCIEPSSPPGDAPCPACGSLMWFSSCSVPVQLWDSRPMRRGSAFFCAPAAPSVSGPTVNDRLRRYQLFAAWLLPSASLILVAATLANSVWHSRAVSEMVGWAGLSLLTLSLCCLVHSGALHDGRLMHTTREQAPGPVRGWYDLEPRQKRTPPQSGSKNTLQSDESGMEDHPMRDRLLDG
jgi:hypothetical protein